MQVFKDQIIAAINTTYPELDIRFSQSKDHEQAHLAIPCFTFAKVLRRSPQQIAEDLGTLIKSLQFLAEVQTSNGYLNIFLKPEALFGHVLQKVSEEGSLYGSSKKGIGKSILVEHTSINPNASPHVGRARNAMIGDVIVRLLRFEGYEVDVHYFVNDIGKQIGMLMLGAQDRDEVTFKDLLGLYVDVNDAIKKDPSLEEKVFDLLHHLEAGDPKVKKGFRDLVNICIKGQTSILAGLDIHYDTFDYESDYLFNNRLSQVLDDFKATGKLEEDQEGRYVLDLEGYDLPMRSPYMPLTRKDKTSLYPLRDLAYNIDKMKAEAERNIIILGEDQKLYHRQIGAALDLLGMTAPEPVHYSFVLLAEGKMATRKGTVVLLEDFMEEAYKKASQEIANRRDLADPDLAKAIGNSAVRYAILKTNNDKNVTFDWNQALSFEGDTGPYLQYSLARIHSIIKKAGLPKTDKPTYDLLGNKEEMALICHLADMEEMIEHATRVLSPSIIASYLYQLTKKFTDFYHHHSVLHADTPALKDGRLHLVIATKQVIENCFNLLGIETITEM